MIKCAGRENISLLTRQGVETPEDVRNDVFRLWVEYGRGWKQVADKTGIAIRTLHDWAARDQWEQRRLDQADAFMPGTRAETAIAAQLARHNATVRLQQIAFDAKEHGTKPDLQEVQALKLIAQLGEKAQEVPRSQKPAMKRDYRTLNTAELATAERELKGEK